MTTDNTIFVDQIINIDFIILNEDKNIVDVSDASINYVLRAKGYDKKIKGAAVIDGPAGLVRYVTQIGDMNVPGEYVIQSIVTIHGVEYPSTIVDFEVLSRI